MTNKLVCDKISIQKEIYFRLICTKGWQYSKQAVNKAGRQAGRISPAFLGLLKIT